MQESGGDGRLQGKVAIVTGAGGDIGRAICVRYAREGARVLAADLSPELAEATAGAIQEAGGDGRAFAVDISQPGAAEGMVRAAAERWGRVDVLVNAAARFKAIQR